MHWKKIAIVAVGAALSAATAVGTPAAAAPVSSPALHDSTKTNVLAAMHGEAFAYLSYQAYSAQATREGHPRVAGLYARTSLVERDDHYAGEARLVGLVGSNADNLRDAIAGEVYESTVMYPGFADVAAKAGDMAAATLFTEIGHDEALHASNFQTALRALTDPSVAIPTGPASTPVPIPSGPARSSGATLANLLAAMHGEAFAYAKYSLFAEHARQSGIPALADLFVKSSLVERGEHFAEEGILAGLVGDTATNLRGSIAGEKYEATTMYPGYARAAAQVGDWSAAKLLREIAGDERRHWHQYAAALACLTH